MIITNTPEYNDIDNNAGIQRRCRSKMLGATDGPAINFGTNSIGRYCSFNMGLVRTFPVQIRNILVITPKRNCVHISYYNDRKR